MHGQEALRQGQGGWGWITGLSAGVLHCNRTSKPRRAVPAAGMQSPHPTFRSRVAEEAAHPQAFPAQEKDGFHCGAGKLCLWAPRSTPLPLCAPLCKALASLPFLCKMGGLWAKLCAPTVHMLTPWLPRPQDEDGFGGGVSKEGMKVQWGHKGGSWSHRTGVLIRRGDQGTDTHRGRTQGGEKGLRRNQPCPHLVLRFQDRERYMSVI